jgi:3'(2'), 5'-bisphosphate nucleotidase
MHDLAELLAIARPIAWGAAEILLKYYESPQDLQITDKGSHEGEVTSADLAANEYILENLQQKLGTKDFAYLSEETEDDESRLEHDWVWMIDPMDGTSDFIKRTGEFAVHIGLAYQQRPILGLVAIPVAGKLFTAISGGGAHLELQDGSKTPLRVSNKIEIENMVAISSRSHRSEKLDYILKHLPKEGEIALGSIGGKLAAITEGRADYYVSISGHSAPKDWDYCAPEIILTEAGGKITHFDLTPLTYNNEDVFQWGGIIASNRRCHADLCELSQAALSALESQEQP